ncbi:ufm1-specific protease 1-like [Paramacrobiotus metropolitanus]|uniref:ufm1-specific protease 1-like n=1 Tax=Paramacrobiotus metropolitanus TaxID=2943436 RepID=UPI002445CB3C|nr:ufm1-specific protease 1-like [Paramacrobiotus metropolitanus]
MQFISIVPMKSNRENSNRCDASVEKEYDCSPNYSLIRNIHVGFPSPAASSAVSLVRDDYRYFHYLCDSFDDRNWGCGYRVLQTLSSWIDPESSPLSLREMIVVLSEMETGISKSALDNHHVENPWIGTFEGFLILDRVYDVSCRIDFIKSPKEFEEHTPLIYKHFAESGAPIFMGGDQDCYGKCVLGICLVDKEHHLLILDPHFVGILDNKEEAYRKGCLTWTPVKEFLRESIYNLLMPLSHGQMKFRPAR